jgi:DNA-binding transcriptional LysR family regulator
MAKMTDAPAGSSPGTAYKELGLPQLRTFVEVARQGSQAAAARVLGLAQPTVWEQLRALERHLDTKLFLAKGRGCVLTDDGERLVRMAQPLLAAFTSLPLRFHEERGLMRRELSIVSTPRCLAEDLPPCIGSFEEDHPEVMLRLFELGDQQVIQRIVDQESDLGFTPGMPTTAQMRHIEVETVYELGYYVICPKSHPLAKRKKIAPEDLLEYPVVNGPGTFYGPRLCGLEAQIEADKTQQRRVAGYYVSTIRQFVKSGFGVGIVPRRDERAADPDLHERSISDAVGRLPLQAVWAKGSYHPYLTKFVEIVKRMLQ